MKITVFSGAGISAESGIPTFRDKLEGLWENIDPMKVAHIESWEKDPQMVSEFHEKVRVDLLDKKPNDAHHYFASLEKEHDVTIITQNIDNLHEQAGSSKVYHLHGEINRVKCTSTGEVHYIDNTKGIGFGKKTVKGGLFKPYTVLFGEMPHHIDKCAKVLEETEILIIVGTSFDISYVLPFIVTNIDPNIPVYYVDKNPSYHIKGHFKDINIINDVATKGVGKILI